MLPAPGAADDGGHLLAFARQDGAIRGRIDISVGKARTAALMKMTTEDLGKAAAPGAPLFGIEVTNGGLVIFGGRIPSNATARSSARSG